MSVDAVVIGAGISGAATALELAEAGLSVILLDRWAPAAMASGWTLAGVRQSGRHPAELPLARAAVRQWTQLAERLDADLQYRQEGNLRLARTEAEQPVIERLVAEQAEAGLDVTLLRGPEIQAIAPAISPTVRAACHCPSDGHANPTATVQAFVAAATRRGVITRFGERALAIEMHQGRAIAVQTDKGRIPTSHVVIAAGVFGNTLLEPLGAAIPLEIMLVAAMRSVPMPQTLHQVIGVANADVAGRQQADGCFRVTSGVQPWQGHLRDGPTPTVFPEAAALAQIVETFGAIIPAFRTAEIEAIWAGLLDMTPDALPVLDRVAENVVLALGFSGHGFCLGPITGQILAALVTDQPTQFDLAPFQHRRFANWNAKPPTINDPVTLHG